MERQGHSGVADLCRESRMAQGTWSRSEAFIVNDRLFFLYYGAPTREQVEGEQAELFFKSARFLGPGGKPVLPK